MLLQDLQSFLNQITQIFILSLSVVYFVTDIHSVIKNCTSLIFEHVEDGENLSVVWDQCFSDHVSC